MTHKETLEIIWVPLLVVCLVIVFAIYGTYFYEPIEKEAMVKNSYVVYSTSSNTALENYLNEHPDKEHTITSVHAEDTGSIIHTIISKDRIE